MTRFDPRLAPVLVEKGRSGREAGLFGVGLLLVEAFCVAGYAISDVKRGNPALLVVCLVVFILPGLILLHLWLRGPERTSLVRALTERRADLTEWGVDYVSSGYGVTRSRVWLRSRSLGAEEITLGHADAAGLIAYLAEAAPQAKSPRNSR